MKLTYGAWPYHALLFCKAEVVMTVLLVRNVLNEGLTTRMLLKAVLGVGSVPEESFRLVYRALL